MSGCLQCHREPDLWVKAVRRLGVTRQALSELVNEKTGISVEMAIRLSKAFGPSPEAWLGMQMAYDLWQARERMATIDVRRFDAA
jgi:addiction module HigA family antidote